MAAGIDDKFTKTFNSTNPNVARVDANRIAGATSLSCDNLAGWPTNTDSAVHFSTYKINTSNQIIPGTQIDWKGIVTGTTIGSLVRKAGATDNGNSIGDVVEMNPTGSWGNDLMDGILYAHNQDGSLKTQPVKDALGITGDPTGGWSILNSGTPPTVSSGYNKGNKEFDLTFANVDLTPVLSPDMKLKVDRTGTTPTQCTDLTASSSQYWTKASPTGITGTNNQTLEFCINLKSYGADQIVGGRRNANDGLQVRILASGQVSIFALSAGGANVKTITSNQALPLNQDVWVSLHIDVASFTTATNKIYIDGVDVPVTLTTTGTLTSFTLAGDLRIGANHVPGEFLNAKISHVRWWNAIRTATQIRDNMYIDMVGNETNLVGQWIFNGNGNDSTSNANHLTASGGAVATNAGNPFHATEFARITSVTKSGADTIVKVYTGDNNSIPNMTLQNPYYSTQKTPFGWPGIKWRWIVKLGQNFQTSSTSTTPIPGLSATVTIPGSIGTRGVKIKGYSTSASGGATSVYYIYRDGAQISQANQSTSNDALNIHADIPELPGQHTYDLRCLTTSGGSPLTFSGSPTQPGYLVVEVED